MIAQPEPPDTDQGMPSSPARGSLAAKKNSDHTIGAIRPSLLRAPDSPRVRPAAAAADAESCRVVAIPAPRPKRDGAARLGAIVPLDANNRVFATKPLAALGWDAGTELVAEVHGNTAIVRAGVRTRDQAWLLPTVLDKKLRLRVPPGVKGALQVRTGEQIVVCAVPATGELHLSAAADLLQEMTGEVTCRNAPLVTTPGTPPPEPPRPHERNAR